MTGNVWLLPLILLVVGIVLIFVAGTAGIVIGLALIVAAAAAFVLQRRRTLP